MNTRIFYDWVPAKLDLWLLLILSTTLAFTAGIPSTISGFVMGAQSSTPPDVSMASYAYFSGMACVLPLTLRLKQFTNIKTLLVIGFLLVIFFNFILSESDQPLTMVMISFAMGSVKMIATLVVVLSLIPILMPKGERYQLYCIYYPLSMFFSPVSGLMSAYLSSQFDWKLSFHAQNLFLFIGLLLTIALVHPKLAGRKVKLYQYDWLGTILLASTLLLVSYVLTYGLTENWFHSVTIQSAAAGALLTTVLFLQRSFRIRRPLFDISALKYWKTLVGLFMMLILCLYFNTSTIISPFLTIIFKSNPLQSAIANTFVLPGYLTGTLLCFLYYRKYTNFKVMGAFACICYLTSNIWMYYITSSATGTADLFAPMYFRAMGCIVTYISVGLYITMNIPYRYINDITVIIVILRSLGAPLIAGTVFSNWMYRGQISHINRLADSMDALNPFVSARNASLMASVKTQASLLVLRDIYGALIVIGFILLIFIIVFPFHGTSKRLVFNWKNPFYGKEVAGVVPI